MSVSPERIEVDAHTVASAVLYGSTFSATSTFIAESEEQAKAVFDRAKEIIEEMAEWR